MIFILNAIGLIRRTTFRLKVENEIDLIKLLSNIEEIQIVMLFLHIYSQDILPLFPSKCVRKNLDID